MNVEVHPAAHVQGKSSRSLWDPERQREIEARLATLTPQSERRWGRMTVGEMLAHVAQVQRVPVGDVSPRAVPGLYRLRPVAHAVIHWVPWPKGRIRSPAGAGPRPSSFAVDRTVLLELIHCFTSRDRSGTWPPHPLFGPMSAHDWGVFCYRHLDHHLRQFGA